MTAEEFGQYILETVRDPDLEKPLEPVRGGGVSGRFAVLNRP